MQRSRFNLSIRRNVTSTLAKSALGIDLINRALCWEDAFSR